ncbi:MAG: magnesium transporter [Pseudomonadales bacterium]|nr:magnesium transporter [Pseudomonadales bacterium]
MTADTTPVAASLNRYFLLNFPAEAARQIESFAAAEVLPSLQEQDAAVLVPVWSKLVPLVAATLTRQLPTDMAQQLLTEIPPGDAVRILFQLPATQRGALLETLSPATRHELEQLMSYPEDSAGRLMDTRIPTYRGSMTVQDALDSLRRAKMKTARSLYLVDDQGRIVERVLLQELALADPASQLHELARPVRATVQATASREEVLEAFSRYVLLDLPVVDIDGVLLGVIINNALVQAVQEESSADIQTMVGVSREERALSSPLFAVKKRMPWLQVNLLTAFLAAAVVGLFENTIAQVTALAILLPVVAGQSGNAGAQALAVTMRGLALREITIRHWFAVMFKEVRVGFLNGLAIATTCGIGVYLWSGSPGLVAVICLSMVLAMVAAGFAGAVVPILLVRLGQDPAQSSSIILTTVTDVAGFFSFLGIATLLMQFL